MGADAAALRARDSRGGERSIPEIDAALAPLSASARVAWALEHLPSNAIVSSSFGIQAAVMLHLVTRVAPRIPVVLLDTGYLFPETYRFIDELVARLDLNLQVYRAELSAAWQEARWGRPWEEDGSTLDEYNRRNKIEPMQRACRALAAGTWFAGLRREQSSTRRTRAFAERAQDCIKVYPILDWTHADVHRYLGRHDLPYHPLWAQGYVSVGDVHSTAPLLPGMLEEETRFRGRTRECGLHIGGDGI
jgi:phosphoadenosine phosphosulfate reductase